MKLTTTVVDLPELVPIPQAARILGVSPRTVLRWLTPADGRLTGVRHSTLPGHPWRGVHRHALLRCLQERIEAQNLNNSTVLAQRTHDDDLCPRCTIRTPHGQLCPQCRRETRGLPYWFGRYPPPPPGTRAAGPPPAGRAAPLAAQESGS